MFGMLNANKNAAPSTEAPKLANIAASRRYPKILDSSVDDETMTIFLNVLLKHFAIY
jgi:hypothetical protein